MVNSDKEQLEYAAKDGIIYYEDFEYQRVRRNL